MARATGRSASAAVAIIGGKLEIATTRLWSPRVRATPGASMGDWTVLVGDHLGNRPTDLHAGDVPAEMRLRERVGAARRGPNPNHMAKTPDMPTLPSELKREGRPQAP